LAGASCSVWIWMCARVCCCKNRIFSPPKSRSTMRVKERLLKRRCYLYDLSAVRFVYRCFNWLAQNSQNRVFSPSKSRSTTRVKECLLKCCCYLCGLSALRFVYRCFYWLPNVLPSKEKEYYAG
jgi:hypothetical protein